MSTPFDFDSGTAQGRIASTQAADGSYVFELGHAERILEHLDSADIAIEQSATFDFGTQKLVRCQVRLKSPTVLPQNATATWYFRAELDGVVFYTRAIEPNGKEIVLNDVAISLADATTSTVIFRLFLEVFEGGS